MAELISTQMDLRSILTQTILLLDMPFPLTVMVASMNGMNRRLSGISTSVLQSSFFASTTKAGSGSELVPSMI